MHHLKSSVQYVWLHDFFSILYFVHVNNLQQSSSVWLKGLVKWVVLRIWVPRVSVNIWTWFAEWDVDHNLIISQYAGCIRNLLKKWFEKCKVIYKWQTYCLQLQTVKQKANKKQQKSSPKVDTSEYEGLSDYSIFRIFDLVCDRQTPT